MASFSNDDQRYGEEKGLEVTFEDSNRLIIEDINSSRLRKRAHRSASQMNDDLTDRALATFVESDKDKDKTFARTLVETHLSKYHWYYPSPREDSNNSKATSPSLMKAWAYYEHVTLPRYTVLHPEDDDHHHRQQNRVMAEPGDNGDTKLYHPLKTPPAALGEWGIGVGMYFSTLKQVSGLLFFSGLILLVNMAYYDGDRYDNHYDSPYALLKGSAVCMNKEWVVCQDCKEEDWEANPEQYATFLSHTQNIFTSDDFNEKNLAFVQHNLCQGAEMGQSMLIFSVILLLYVCFGFLEWYLRQLEVRFDENWMTASDYSIWVRNPPGDAKDPEEWRQFFDQWAAKQVTCCTIALDNEELLRTLIKRRAYKLDLENILNAADIYANLDDDAQVKDAVDKLLLLQKNKEAENKSCWKTISNNTLLPLLRLFQLIPQKPETLAQEIIRLKEKTIELEKRKYNAISVFVTFETEEGQRLALQSLDISTIDRLSNSSKNIGYPALFRGKHILEVEEAPEPNAVRWLDLNYKLSTRIIERSLTLVMTIGLAGLSGYLVLLTRRNLGALYGAVLLSIFNFLIPNVVKLMLSLVENHTSENSYQKSLFLKVSTFRWIGTVFLIDVISETITTLQDGNRDLLPSVTYIFLSELITTPLLQIIDFGGIFKKHIIAPRAKTQRDMNLAFSGTYYNIGERYTDMTKVFALAVYYSSIFPISLMFGSVILIVQYYADKYCLMRVWSRAPFVGPNIAQFCRRYFFNLALLLFTVVSTYRYALFPYDNVCFPTDPSGQYQGDYSVTLTDESKTIKNIQVSRSTAVKYCNQFNYIIQGFSNPWHSQKHPTDSKWMTEGQERTADIFGVLTLMSLVYFFIVVFGTKVYKFTKHFFLPCYEPEGKDQRIDFSNLTEKLTIYVPQTKVGKFTFPLLACDIDDIELSLIGFNPEPVPYDYYNLMYECFITPMRPMRKRGIERKSGSMISKSLDEFTAKNTLQITQKKQSYDDSIFSIVKQWQPKWVEDDGHENS